MSKFERTRTFSEIFNLPYCRMSRFRRGNITTNLPGQKLGTSMESSYFLRILIKTSFLKPYTGDVRLYHSALSRSTRCHTRPFAGVGKYKQGLQLSSLGHLYPVPTSSMIKCVVPSVRSANNLVVFAEKIRLWETTNVEDGGAGEQQRNEETSTTLFLYLAPVKGYIRLYIALKGLHKAT